MRLLIEAKDGVFEGKIKMKVHDVEDTILTINKVKKAYSPWNSKIYSLREVPNKK